MAEGDFGPQLIDQTLTGGVGTATYAAPEQLVKGQGYSEKCDMYSMGIVLFELFWPMGTGMERYGHSTYSIMELPIVPHFMFLILKVSYVEDGLGIFCTCREMSMLISRKRIFP